MKIDAHYYGILAFARAVGFKKEYAHTIAYASQFVDDAKINHIVLKDNISKEIETELVSNNPSFFDMATCHSYFKLNTFNYEAMTNNTIAFHFVPGCKGENFSKKLRCSEESPIILDILKDIKKEDNLIKLGIALHVYADTFSHQGFSGLISKVNDVKDCIPHSKIHKTIFQHLLDKYRKHFPINFEAAFDKVNPTYGHAQVLSYPDIPYLNWEYKYDFSDEFSQTYKTTKINNQERFTNAFLKIKSHLEEYLKLNPNYKDNELNFQNFDPLFKVLISENPINKRIDNWKSIMIELGLFQKSDVHLLNYNENLWLKEAFKNFNEELFENRKVENVELNDNFKYSNWYIYYKAVKWYKSKFFTYIKNYSLNISK